MPSAVQGQQGRQHNSVVRGIRLYTVVGRHCFPPVGEISRLFYQRNNMVTIFKLSLAAVWRIAGGR